MGESASEPRPADAATRRGRPRSVGSSVLTPPTGLPAVPDLATAPALSPPLRPRDPVVEPCACGHARAAHDHYRPGSDCGACGADDCTEFRPEGGPIRRLLRGMGLVG